MTGPANASTDTDAAAVDTDAAAVDTDAAAVDTDAAAADTDREPGDTTTDAEPGDTTTEVVAGSQNLEGDGEASETEVMCPGCGLTLVGESPRPSAEWFCPRCDYPLFWAKEPEPDARPASRAARRRLPGTGGRIRAGSEACWHCGEMSEPGDDTCRRCAATLPKPMAPTVQIDRPIPVPVLRLVRPSTWPYVAAAACAGVSIGASIAIWLSGGGG